MYGFAHGDAVGERYEPVVEGFDIASEERRSWYDDGFATEVCGRYRLQGAQGVGGSYECVIRILVNLTHFVCVFRKRQREPPYDHVGRVVVERFEDSVELVGEVFDGNVRVQPVEALLDFGDVPSGSALQEPNLNGRGPSGSEALRFGEHSVLVADKLLGKG